MQIEKREKLVADLTQLGISEYSARDAINNCYRALFEQGKNWGVAGLVTGAGMGLIGGAPAPGGLVGFVGGAALGMNKAVDSESCGPADWSPEARERLRKDVRFYSTAVNAVKELL